MEKIKCFNDWWEINGDYYEKINVNKIIAKSIWDAAVDTFVKELYKTI